MLPAAARLSRLLLRAQASRVGASAALLPLSRLRVLPAAPRTASRAAFRTRAASASMDSADAGAAAAAAAAPAAKKPRVHKAPAADASADAAAGGADAKPKGRGRAKAAAATGAEGDEEGGAGGSPSKAPAAKKAKAEPAEKTVLPRTPTPRAPPPAGCVLLCAHSVCCLLSAPSQSCEQAQQRTTQHKTLTTHALPAAARLSRRSPGTWLACAPC
jgi:hypothetical protein